MIQTGQIVDLQNKDAFYFKGNEPERKIFYHLLSIGELNVGKTFTFDTVPIYRSQSIFKNANGNYKLIGIRKGDGILYPFFKHKNGEEVVISIKSETFNDFILGDFFDLILIPVFTGRNVFNNLPANKTSTNVEVIILDKMQDGYLALYGERTIFLYVFSNLDIFIGESILLDVYENFWVKFGNIGSMLYSPKLVTSTFEVTSQPRDITAVSIDNKPYIFYSRYLFNTNNSGLSTDIRFWPLKFADLSSFRSAPPNTGYQLISITYAKYPVYGFVNSADPTDVFTASFSNSIDLNNRLGSFFNLNTFPYSLLLGQTPTKDTSAYLLKQIYEPAGIYIYIRNGETFAVNSQNFDVSSAVVGQYFDLKLTPYIFGTVDDVNKVL